MACRHGVKVDFSLDLKLLELFGQSCLESHSSLCGNRGAGIRGKEVKDCDEIFEVRPVGRAKRATFTEASPNGKIMGSIQSFFKLDRGVEADMEPGGPVRQVAPVGLLILVRKKSQKGFLDGAVERKGAKATFVEEELSAVDLKRVGLERELKGLAAYF